MKDDQLKQLISRRQWLKSTVVFILSLFPNYSFSEIAQQLPDKPKHHTKNGFRNYPLVPPSSTCETGGQLLLEQDETVIEQNHSSRKSFLFRSGGIDLISSHAKRKYHHLDRSGQFSYQS
jgi:hypothetical protein